jgi:hypothetical protein
MPRSAFQFKVEWNALEHEHKQRSQDWFWAMGIVVLSLAIVSVILGNIIFAILIVVSAICLSLFINKDPDIVHASIDEIGITKDKTRYPFSTLESFWLEEDHPHKKIILQSKKVFMPLIIVPVGDEVDLDKLHRILSKYLVEEYHSVPFVEVILEYLGF